MWNWAGRCDRTLLTTLIKILLGSTEPNAQTPAPAGIDRASNWFSFFREDTLSKQSTFLVIGLPVLGIPFFVSKAGLLIALIALLALGIAGAYATHKIGMGIGIDFTLFMVILASYLTNPWIATSLVVLEFAILWKLERADYDLEYVPLFVLVAFIVPYIPFAAPLAVFFTAFFIGDMLDNVWMILDDVPLGSILIFSFPRYLTYTAGFFYLAPAILWLV